ncbi:hypothetical protein MHK_008589 [Candidatus Magnetomorum sp. HK-1]|nr:hypothetical protein MHK_008589 [Candidatus Magnetomorum sp. HK-1]
MTSNADISSIQLLASLSSIAKKITGALKDNSNAEQLDFLTQEHRQVMEQLKKVPASEMKEQKSLLKNIYEQIQTVQEDLVHHHQIIKEKLISHSKKRKQLNAYNAL